MKITKVEKSLAPAICVAILSLFFLLCPLASEAKAMDYAVQVAALRSQQNALDLAKGLRAQGINAYWIGKNVQTQGPLYRVRIGRFTTIESAYLYAEELMDSGLFNAYAIAAYEQPASATLTALAKEDPKMDKLQAFVSPVGGFASMAAEVLPAARATSPVPATSPVSTIKSTPPVTMITPAKAAAVKLNTMTIDLVASIGTRGWILLSSEEVISATQKNPTALGREVAKLAAAVGSRRWSFNTDVSKLLAPAAPAPSVAAAPVNIADLARNTPSSFDPVIASATPAVRATATAISAPEIDRRPLPPTSTSPIYPGARAVNYLAPPKLQGSIEMRDGQVLLTLRNLDGERAFTGSARVTLTNEKDQQDIVPMPLNLAPGREEKIPLPDARVLDGDWMMMVYDQGGVARLVRGASLAPPKPVAPAAAPQPAPAPAAPPGFVTGMVDATGEWTLSDSSATQPQSGAEPGQGQENSGNGASAPNPGSTGSTAQENGPLPEVTVSPRQLATTSESVTMEFDISASRPINYLTITIRAGDFQDTRQALMSTPQGRVPFLVPANYAKEGFSYELKDDKGNILASGAGDFRMMQK